MVLLAGEGRNEGESRCSQPGSEATAAALSGQGVPAAGTAGFMIHWNQEGHDASRHVWENAHQLQQPVFWCMRGP